MRDDIEDSESDEVEQTRRSPPERRIPAPQILHADESVLVVNKPAGALSVAGRGDHPLLAELLIAARRVPADEPFRIVHRLDLECSGVIVYARTLESQRSLTAQFEARTIEKCYLALVRGFVANDGQVTLPIRSDDEGSRARIDPKRGRPAETHYRILERMPGFTLLECKPLTGRLHQIRVHMSAIGHPLAVDSLYGGGKSLLLSELKSGYKQSTRHEERPLIARLTLHAQSIAFSHPTTGKRVEFAAEIPRDLRATIAQLGRL